MRNKGSAVTNRGSTSPGGDGADDHGPISPLERERRRQRALLRLGTNDPRCVHCGMNDWRCLEAHHIAGKVYDTITVILCRNCHRQLSDSQKDHPKKIGQTVEPLDSIGHFLLGLADLFEKLIEKLREFGQALIERAQSDNVAPGA